MKLKIYTKKGNKDFAEKKLIRELQPILERKMQDPNFASKFRPASNFDDLQRLHNIHLAEDAQIISEPIIPKPEPIINKREDLFSNTSDNNFNNNTMENEHTLANEKEINLKETRTSVDDTSVDNSTIDPFNREEPIIRDYVLKDDAFTDPSGQSHVNNQSTFNEPTNFDDAFSIPGSEDDKQPSQGNGSNNNNTQSHQQKKFKPEPVNPYFDEQSNQQKKKQTKRFAKYITGFVCFALEKGYVWYTTKDINEAKIIAYELKGEIDVNIMLSLDANTDITVKQFFKKSCSEAIINSKIDQEDQDELADALADVLMEKGIAPTPMQTLIMVSVQLIGKQAFSAFLSKSTNDNILNQLKDMQKEKVSEDDAEMEAMYKDAENNKQQTQSTSLTTTEPEYAEVID